ncbi:MAG: hypothetical protein ACK5B9_09680 [Flavobacteriia bacterium]
MNNKLILSSILNENSQIDLSNLTSGYYILQICDVNFSNLYFPIIKE